MNSNDVLSKYQVRNGDIKTIVCIKLNKNLSHHSKLSFSSTVKCKELFDLNDNYTNGGQGRCTRIIAGNQLFH